MASDAQREQARKWGQVVARSWADGAFKRRLMTEPAAVLREQGIEVPAGLELRVVENTARLRPLVLPPKPAEGELSEAQLERAAGGATDFTGCT